MPMDTNPLSLESCLQAAVKHTFRPARCSTGNIFTFWSKRGSSQAQQRVYGISHRAKCLFLPLYITTCHIPMLYFGPLPSKTISFDLDLATETSSGNHGHTLSSFFSPQATMSCEDVRTLRCSCLPMTLLLKATENLLT